MQRIKYVCEGCVVLMFCAAIPSMRKIRKCGKVEDDTNRNEERTRVKKEHTHTHNTNKQDINFLIWLTNEV